MKKLTLLSFSIPLFFLTMNFPVNVVRGAADPYAVTLYRQMNYAEPIGTWKLSPGMRMLKIPRIDKVPLSISLGSQVGAILFPDYDFTSSLKGGSGAQAGLGVRDYLIPYYKFPNSTPRMYEKYISTRCSLIIHRKDIGDWLGVLLEGGNPPGQFYSLPERASDAAIIYSKVPYANSGSYILWLQPGGNYQYSMAGHPNLNDLEVTVTSAGGARVKLPGLNNKDARYELKKHGIDQISSLMIQYKGPFDQKAYLGSVAAGAPAAPTGMRFPDSPSKPPVPPPHPPPATGFTPPQQEPTGSVPPPLQVPPDRSTGDPICPEEYFCRVLLRGTSVVCQYEPLYKGCYSRECIDFRNCNYTAQLCDSLRRGGANMERNKWLCE